MKKVLLMGNPNVGKSAVFSRLTGINVVASNYPGSTVEFTQGNMSLGDEEAILIDVPGTYGLEATCKAEQIAIDMLNEGDVIINVIDATNLERNLHLTLHLLEKNVPVIIALNMWDDAQHKGIKINNKKMEKMLDVPVVPTVGASGEGIKELISRIGEASSPKNAPGTEEGRWTETGRIVKEVQCLKHRHHTLLERFSDASIQPLTGLPIAIGVMIAAFTIVRFLGEGFIGYISEPLFDNIWLPLMTKFSSFLNPGSFFHSVLIGKLIDGSIDFGQSFGLLTTGLFIPLGAVLPYVLSFYLVIGFLEDFGYLPRLAVLLDSIMHKMGLHGWAIIPTLLGFGCNVLGILATRVLEDRRQKLIASTIICIGVPCAALQAMIWGLLGNYGAGYVGIVYLSLFITWLILGRILNTVLKGQSPELIMEVPPYRWPSVQTIAKKLWMRIIGFLKEALPLIFISILIVNLLYFLGIFDFIANLTAPIVTKVWGLPKESVSALVVGFLRKDVAVGMLELLNLTAKQLTVAATVLSMFFPCIATFVILIKELGLKDVFKSIICMLLSSLIVGGVLNIIL